MGNGNWGIISVSGVITLLITGVVWAHLVKRNNFQKTKELKQLELQEFV